MLNHIWAFLIIVSLVTAVGYDTYDEMHDTYRNGKSFPVKTFCKPTLRSSNGIKGEVVLDPEEFRRFYGVTTKIEECQLPISLFVDSTGNGTFLLELSTDAPKLWKTMAQSVSATEQLRGEVRGFSLSDDDTIANCLLIFEPIHFVKLKAITNAAMSMATTAVEIALGLIGIMALWLGLIKIAEAAGFLTILTRMLTPITRRLFPDVPPNHPAIAAIIMNVAANMLGLSNAATPIGLKAMEELNKLNPTLGTATNAMVTFLAINTGGLILIPATAIAVRAAAGSNNPGIIIGTSIVGALCATVAGVIASKLLQRLPWYAIDREKDDSEKSHG